MRIEPQETQARPPKPKESPSDQGFAINRAEVRMGIFARANGNFYRGPQPRREFMTVLFEVDCTPGSA
jgi:hypothetical protein